MIIEERDIDSFVFDVNDESYIIVPPESDKFAAGICYEFEWDTSCEEWKVFPNTGGVMYCDTEHLKTFIKSLLKSGWLFDWG